MCVAGGVTLSEEGRGGGLVRVSRTAVECWGRNVEGQLDGRPGPDSHRPRVATALGMTDWSDGLGLTPLDLGVIHTCVHAGHTIRCWGDNAAGILGGHLADQTVASPVVVSEGEPRALRVGSAHTCWLDGEGANAAFCFGDNGRGQLGAVPNSYRPSPMPLVEIGELRQLDAGGPWTCGISSDARVRCWGAGSGKPFDVAGVEGPTAIGVGAAHGCVVDADRVRCFGDDTYGQLGRGTVVGSDGDAAPAALGEPVVQVSAGGFVPVTVSSRVEIEYDEPSPSHTCAITTRSELYCWGANDAGQLGVGATEHSATPLRVPLDDVELVSAGGRHTCALAAGELYCWGSNTRGQLGLDPKEVPHRADPVRVSLD